MVGRHYRLIESKCNNGRMPLSYASMNGYDSSVIALLSHKNVNFDPKDYYGSTPLSIAARNGRTEVVKLLVVVERVDIDSKDHFGRTPLCWARRGGYADIAQVLLSNSECRGIPE
ncbi:ankyrin repeat-containing domain protein [Xylogone sp. PMI_703]|nr:ankyrin repeat-containing domain protein [Xylogone sp. PMI_703]